MFKKSMIIYVFLGVLSSFCAAGDGLGHDSCDKIETFVYKPANIDTLCLWVPADKVGPLMNRACKAKTSVYSKSLPAFVEHTKNKHCPFAMARLLAQKISKLHELVLPLTIFNGWQWEFSYSMSEYDTNSYVLPARGGSWENCYEAIYIKTLGEISVRWLTEKSEQNVCHDNGSKSNIKVETFINMRTRNGYPKERQLD